MQQGLFLKSIICFRNPSLHKKMPPFVPLLSHRSHRGIRKKKNFTIETIQGVKKQTNGCIFIFESFNKTWV